MMEMTEAMVRRVTQRMSSGWRSLRARVGSAMRGVRKRLARGTQPPGSVPPAATVAADRTAGAAPAAAGPTHGNARPSSPSDRTLGRARMLSAGIAALMAGAGLAGLAVPTLYRDPVSVVAMFRGLDAVAVFIAVPALLTALGWAGRGSARAQVAWVGMLVYTLYTYALYVFGLGFHAVFLVHVALLSLAVFALVLALTGLDVEEMGRRLGRGAPARAASVLLGLLGVSLGGMWVFYALRFALTGAPPQESLLVQTPAGIHLSYALDLTLLVPGYLLAAALLWRGAAWGYVLGGALLCSGVLQQVGYMAELLAQARVGVPGATPFDPVEPAIVGVYVVALLLVLGRPTRSPVPVIASA